jgi:hypothetical protein
MEHERRPRGFVEERHAARPVVAHGGQAQARVGEETHAAAPAEADDAGAQAFRLQFVGGGLDHVDGAVETDAVAQIHPALRLRFAVTQFDPRFDRIEQAGRQGHETGGRQPIGHAADVRVDPEDLLQHDDAAA